MYFTSIKPSKCWSCYVFAWFIRQSKKNSPNNTILFSLHDGLHNKSHEILQEQVIFWRLIRSWFTIFITVTYINLIWQCGRNQYIYRNRMAAQFTPKNKTVYILNQYIESSTMHQFSPWKIWNYILTSSR